MSPAPLNNTLTVLVDTAMIRRLDDAEPAYMIKHALVQDTAHATLLKNENKRLHLLVAIALEQVNAARLDDYAAELARHFEEAEDKAKTFEFSLRAGDLDARVFANAEALEHYGRAIEIAQRGIATPQQIIHLYTRRGRILEVIGKYQDALASYQELHALAEQRGDRSLELASLMLRAQVYSIPLPIFDATLAKQLLLDALGTARELRDEPAEARVLWNLTLLSVQTMRPTDGLMYGELALSIAERLNLREQEGYTLHDLFIPYRSTGQIARAREVQAQARAIFRETHNQALLADNLGMSAQFAMYEGDLARALDCATEGLAISRTIDNPFGMVFNSLFLILIHLERGEHQAALERIREREALIQNSLTSANPGMTMTIQSWFLATLGAFTESAAMEHRAREQNKKPSPPIFRSGQHGLLARTRLLNNDPEGAAADLARGIDGLNLDNALHPGAVHIPFAQAELGLARGEYARIPGDLAAQADWARINEYHLVLAENLLLQGRAYLGLGDAAQALAVLEQAHTLVKRIGSRRLDFQILFALSQAERLCGNAALADHYHAQARAVLNYIVEQTPPNYRAGLLNLPMIRFDLSNDQT